MDFFNVIISRMTLGFVLVLLVLSKHCKFWSTETHKDFIYLCTSQLIVHSWECVFDKIKQNYFEIHVAIFPNQIRNFLPLCSANTVGCSYLNISSCICATCQVVYEYLHINGPDICHNCILISLVLIR